MIQDQKHKCCVRRLIKYRVDLGIEQFREFISDKKMLKLWNTIKDYYVDQWKKGNRGDGWK